MPTITGSIITDCADDNARTRQQLRFSSLFGVQPAFFGLGAEAPDIQAAGNLLDQLDALSHLPASRKEKQQNVILVNVAPRGEKIKRNWPNGTPFCYFYINNTLVVSTYAGRALEVLRQQGLVTSVELLDIPTVVAAAVEWGELTKEQAAHITKTQFRSFEFLPLVTYWLTEGQKVPSTTEELPEHPDLRGKVWQIDNFGNAKTTLSTEDVDFKDGKILTLSDSSKATCYTHLADVPKDATALVIGSSGLYDRRFLEVVVQWKDKGFFGSDSAASRHGLHSGSPVLK